MIKTTIFGAVVRLQDGTITLVHPREMYGMTTGKSKGESQFFDCLGFSCDFNGILNCVLMGF
jgi:hypothetical protein